jgi:hypothetical protein
MRDVVQVEDLKVLFQVLGMEQVGSQLGVIAATFCHTQFLSQN